MILYICYNITMLYIYFHTNMLYINYFFNAVIYRTCVVKTNVILCQKRNAGQHFLYFFCPGLGLDKDTVLSLHLNKAWAKKNEEFFYKFRGFWILFWMHFQTK